MRKIYLLLAVSTVLLASCTKRDYIAPDIDVNRWMQTHDRGTVAYVDYNTGNYIVETYNGYSVIESYGDYSTREYDNMYAYFDNRGIQTIYNYSGNYFTDGRIAESWLSWSDALYVLDQLGYK